MAFTASNGRTQTSLSDINITPLVDVVLVLLIIFMVTAPVLQSGIDVNVPRTRTVREITEERLVISIDKKQRVFLGNDAVNINEIAAKLHQKIRDPQHQFIFIRADEDVPFGAFATVMDAVKQSGISNVSIVNPNLWTLMAGSAEIFFEHDRWGRNLAWSAVLHVGIAGSIVLYAAIAPGARGEGWGSGGGGEAIGVTLVSTIPLPASPADAQNVLANESKGLSKSVPKTEENEPDAIPIADKNAKKSKTQTSSKQQKQQPVEEANNLVPYGEGGPVSGPYGAFSAGAAKGGFGFSGGNGDFGTRFAWYVRVVQQKVSENWLKYEIDPRIRDAQRVYLTFDVMRDGHPANVQIEQSSGVPSLDQSATRAIQRIDTFGPLPPDYSGNKVSVEFWFDYKR